MKRLSWISKIIILFTCTITVGMLPAFAFMGANYYFEPSVCWPNVYGGWFIVPMLFVCACWALGINHWLERRLNVCGHKDFK